MRKAKPSEAVDFDFVDLSDSPTESPTSVPEVPVKAVSVASTGSTVYMVDSLGRMWKLLSVSNDWQEVKPPWA